LIPPQRYNLNLAKASKTTFYFQINIYLLNNHLLSFTFYYFNFNSKEKGERKIFFFFTLSFSL